MARLLIASKVAYPATKAVPLVQQVLPSVKAANLDTSKTLLQVAPTASNVKPTAPLAPRLLSALHV